MCDVHDVAVVAPVIDAEKQMEKPSAVSDVIGMHLIVARSCAACPVVVEIEHVYASVPFCEIVAHEEVAICRHTAEIIFPGIFHHTRVSDAFEHGIAQVLCAQTRDAE